MTSKMTQIRYSKIFTFKELHDKLFIQPEQPEGLIKKKKNIPALTLHACRLETPTLQPQNWRVRCVHFQRGVKPTGSTIYTAKRTRGNPSSAWVLWDILSLCKTGTTSTFETCPSLSPGSTLSNNNSSSAAAKVKGSASPPEIWATGSTESASIKPDT